MNASGRNVLMILLAAVAFSASFDFSSAAEGEILEGLETLPLSEARITGCSNSWPANSLEVVECWEGKRYTRNEACLAIGRFLGNPWASEWQKAAAFSLGQKRGCF
jgi:hypothetical protein